MELIIPNMGLEHRIMVLEQPNMVLEQPNMVLEQRNLELAQPNLALAQRIVALTRAHLDLEHLKVGLERTDVRWKHQSVKLVQRIWRSAVTRHRFGWSGHKAPTSRCTPKQRSHPSACNFELTQA